MTTTPERSLPHPHFTDAEAGAKEFPDSTARTFNYFTPKKRRPSGSRRNALSHAREL